MVTQPTGPDDLQVGWRLAGTRTYGRHLTWVHSILPDLPDIFLQVKEQGNISSNQIEVSIIFFHVILFSSGQSFMHHCTLVSLILFIYLNIWHRILLFFPLQPPVPQAPEELLPTPASELTEVREKLLSFIIYPRPQI